MTTTFSTHLLPYLLAIFILTGCKPSEHSTSKARILISTDIGGTDPDDFQSMIHLLMYADLFQIEGLVSSPYGPGRKAHLLDMIDLYEKDLPQLSAHKTGFPAPDSLRSICKQGTIEGAPFAGYRTATEGSDWIVHCARKSADQPLWVLVWGGLEDLAQALHDAPDIKENIRVYWIGGPNKKWSVNAYAYIAEHHPDLWMIEANATYRGWFMQDDVAADLTNEGFFKKYIRDRGAMGREFINHYEGHIKMGDTPSLAYLMAGNPDDPAGESWGGSFVPMSYSPRAIFTRNTTTADTVAAYATLEWRFPGPKLDIPSDSACFTLEIFGQVWPGYHLGDGIYGVRYSSKKPEVGTYQTTSTIPELNGLTGQYVSTIPWPGKQGQDAYPVGPNWYTDRPGTELFIDEQQGALTVAKHREAYLLDWAARWSWLE